MVEIRNLLPDPWPYGVTRFQQVAGSASDGEFRMCNDNRSFFLKNVSNGAGPCAYCMQLPDLRPGKYVVGLRFLNYYDSVADGGSVLRVREMNGGNNYCVITAKQLGAYIIEQFTLSASDGVRVLLDTPKTVGQYYAIDSLLMMTEEDWTHMRNLKQDDGTPANIRWFAPPKTAAAGVMATPALDRGWCSPSTARRYPHIDVEVAA